MSYYIVKIPFSDDRAYCVESPRPTADDFHPGDFRMGREITYPISPMMVKTDKKHGRVFLDAIPAQGLEFIISPQVQEVLTSLDCANLQYFPVAVKDCFSKKTFSFLVCNIVGLIPCLDTARSEITWSSKGNEIFILRKIALDETAIEKYNNTIESPLKIFRLKESPRYIIVHSDVRQAMADSGIQGIEFKEPAEAGDFL